VQNNDEDRSPLSVAVEISLPAGEMNEEMPTSAKTSGDSGVPLRPSANVFWTITLRGGEAKNDEELFEEAEVESHEWLIWNFGNRLMIFNFYFIF
jgi:hypothetical protein